jgi:predicted hotdog family 3-hydroxylacyl-ACP dehydratase
MLIDKQNIKNYIPQREPFIMLDSLLEANDEVFKGSFQILESNLFLKAGMLSDACLIESIAQTCAAGFGYLGQADESAEPRLGFIGAISKLEVFAHASIHDEVTTTVQVLSKFDQIYLVEGVAESNGVQLIKCQMKIVQA